MKNLALVSIAASILLSCNSSDEKKKQSLNKPKSPEVKREIVTTKKYEDQNGRFRINFPCNDVIKDSIINNDHLVTFFYCEQNVGQSNHMTYILSFYDLLKPEKHSLEYEAEQSAKIAEARILMMKEVNFKNNFEGKEINLISQDTFMKVRIFKIGARLYKVQAGTLPSSGENKAMYDFLNSFEIID